MTRGEPKHLDPRTGTTFKCPGCGKFVDTEAAFYSNAEYGLPEPFCSEGCAHPQRAEDLLSELRRIALESLDHEARVVASRRREVERTITAADMTVQRKARLVMEETLRREGLSLSSPSTPHGDIVRLYAAITANCDGDGNPRKVRP